MTIGQLELEALMHDGGMVRSYESFKQAEERGYASACQYARRILNTYVPAVAEAVRADTGRKRAVGVQAKYTVLLRPLDPYAVAYLAVKVCIEHVLQQHTRKATAGYTETARRVGAAIHQELVAAQIAEFDKELFAAVSMDLKRRMSRKVRHRMANLRHAANARGIVVAEWEAGDAEHVGYYLVNLLYSAGMLVVAAEAKVVRRKTQDRELDLSPELHTQIRNGKYLTGVFTPRFGPCVGQPRDWVSLSDGGWHSQQLQRATPFVIQCRPNARDRIREMSLRPPLDAINHVQHVKWRVNRRTLQVAHDLLAAGIDTKEVLSQTGNPKPSALEWLTPDTDVSSLRPEQLVAFTQWKRETAAWHTENKVRAVRLSRMASTLRVSDYFKEYPHFYFVHFADSRGRTYPLSGAANPQGSDLQKGMLEFARGMEYAEGSRASWHLRRRIANLWGFDKADHESRVAWTEERIPQLLRMAGDPVNNRDWLLADSPWQFLGCLFELADLLKHGKVVGHAVGAGFDGSCNGLQQLSAIIRDEVGGALVNLVPGKAKNDIYGVLANETTQYLRTLDDPLSQQWLRTGITRDLMKQPVMTTPYNVTFNGARDQIADKVRELIAAGRAPHLTDAFEASLFLAKAYWRVRGTGVLSRSIEVMRWLEQAVSAIVSKQGDDAVMLWVTPSGFPASQVHFKDSVKRINVRSLSGAQMRVNVVSEVSEPDMARHKAAFPPNFIHSIDASHMHMVGVAASHVDMDVRFVHDEYGCHAANGDLLLRTVNEQFVALHRHRPLEMLAEAYPEVPDIPAYGALDIEMVRESVFAFD